MWFAFIKYQNTNEFATVNLGNVFPVSLKEMEASREFAKQILITTLQNSH